MHVFLSEKLLQEFIVDCWAASEQNRLWWILNNQTKFRMHSCQGLMDAIAVDPNTDAANVGQ